ncbi:DUF1162-domain-containing protein [Hesseltinella vesiculosa]|uniref:DUF1162-domain-containing protein n=1 Tax=Hesseltinella vesiculosa TaxID=101127 RepID=A0A1X2G336_9FUNG|nr:DUF1162-domain-containing protein [Hesseltinella vesiculosa]
MLESFVSTLLNRFIGAYVSNLNYSQLQIGIWSGSIGELILRIPWSNLKGQSVTIEIKDVFLLAVPRSQGATPEDLEEREYQVKMRKIANLDQAKLGHHDAKALDIKNETFVDQLITRVMNNIQFSVSNIHLRYEDDQSCPDHRFAIGLTLVELSAITTDENWIPKTIDDIVNQVHKLATLEALAIYWDTNATPTLPSDGAQGSVRPTFFFFFHKTKKSQQYLLKPVSGTGRIKLSKSFDSSTPKVDGTLLFDELAFALDNEQYKDMVWMLDAFHSRLKKQKFQHMRPPNEMTPKSDPLAYFRFAANAVLSEIHERNSQWTWEALRKRRDDRKQYIQSFVAIQLGRGTSDESQQLTALERRLTFNDIRFYRNLALHQLKCEKAILDAELKRNEQIAKTRGQQQSWLSSWWYGEEANESDRLALSEEQKRELYEAIDYDEDRAAIAESVVIPEDAKFMVLQISLNKGSFTIMNHPHSHNTTQLSSIIFDSVLLGTTAYSNSWKVSAALGDLQLYDGITASTNYPQLVGVNRNASQDHSAITNNDCSEVVSDLVSPFFFVEYEYQPLHRQGDNALTLLMRNIDIVYNPYFIREVLAFFRTPATHTDSLRALVEAAGETLENIKKQTRSTLAVAIEQHKTLNLHVDMDAPVIIIPESGVVVDAGHINIESQLAPPSKVKSMRPEESVDFTIIYDKFIMKLSQTKVMVGGSVDKCLEQIRHPKQELDYLHLLERIDMNFLLELCILDMAHDVPKLKISGNLPLLSLNFSDVKYRVLTQLPGLIAASGLIGERPPDDVMDEQTKANDDISFNGTKFWDSESVDYFVTSDSEFSIDETGPSLPESKRKSKPSDLNEHQEIYSIAPRHDSKLLDMHFQVEKVLANVFQANDSKEELSHSGQKKLCSLRLNDLTFDYFARPLDTTLDLKLRSLDVVDTMKHGNEFKYLVTSDPDMLHCSSTSQSNLSEEPRPLFHLHVIDVDKKNPSFHKVHHGCDRAVNLTLSTLNFIITSSSVLTLYDYTMKTFVQQEGEPVPLPNVRPSPFQGHSSKTTSSLSLDRIRQPQTHTIQTQVDVYLDSVNFIMNDDGCRIATAELSHGDLSILMQPKKMDIRAKFANFTLTNDDCSQIEPQHNLHNCLLTIQGNELIDLHYETFPSVDETSQHPGYDQSMYMRMGSAQFTFLEKPVSQVLLFLNKFVTMKNIYDKARQAALDTANSQFTGDMTKMHFDIVIRSPVLIFPDERGHALDTVVAHLGEIWASNAFIVEKDGYTNRIKAGLRAMNLTSKYHYADGIADGRKYHLQSLPIVGDIDLDLDITILLSSIDKQQTQPRLDIQGKLNDIRMYLIGRQYKFLLDTAQAVSRVYGQLQEVEHGESIPRNELARFKSSDGSDGVLSPILSDGRADDSLNVCINVKAAVIELELFADDGNLLSTSLKPVSFSTFALNNSSIAVFIYMNGGMEIKWQVETLAMNDTRPNIRSQFKEIVPPVRHGHQIIAQCDISSPSEFGSSQGARHGIILLTINEPKMILSLDHVLLLAKFFTEPAEDNVSHHTAGTRRLSVGGQPPGIDFSYRLNITNVEFILLDNPDNRNSEAMILSADRVMISQQTVMAFAVKQVGMFLCRMGSRDTSTLRLIQPFDFSISMNNNAEYVNGQMQKVELELDVDLLILRLSYRDLVLVASIFSKAFDLYKQTTDMGQTNRPDQSHADPRTGISRLRFKDEAGFKPHGRRRHETMRATFQGMQVILIEDIHEFPMIDMTMKAFHIEAADWTRSLSAGVDFSTFVNYFNVKNSHWEPLIEPWQFTLYVSKDCDQSPLNTKILSNLALNMNITHAFLENSMALVSAFDKQKNLIYAGERGHDSSYRVCNRTGYDIHVWNSSPEGDVSVKKIENGKEIPWSFDDWRKRREMTDVVSNIMNVQVEGALWETLRNIHVDTEGEHMYPLRPVVRSVQHHVVFDVKLVNYMKVVTIRSAMVIENLTLLSVDITLLDARGYSDGTFAKIAPGDTYALPIERAYHNRFCVRPDAGFGYKWTSHAIHWSDFVSNGDYKKTINCVSEDGGNALPPFTFQIYAKTDRRNPLYGAYCAMKVRLSAPVEIENLLPYDINFRIVDKTAQQDYNSFLRKSGSIPLHVVENNHLLLLNIHLPDAGKFGFDASDYAIISTKGSEDIEIEDKLQLKDQAGNFLSLQINNCELPETGGARKYSIFSPYVIINKSGYPLSLRPKLPWQSSMFLSHTQIWRCLPAQTSKPFMYSYPKPDNHNRSVIQIPGSDWSQPLSFEAVHSVSDVTLVTLDQSEEVHMGIHVQEGVGKHKLTKIITITPRFILSNRLCTNLRYRESESRAGYDIQAQVRMALYQMRKCQDKQLCVKLPGVNNVWSSPFDIQNIGKVHVRLNDGQGNTTMLVRVTTILQEATIFIILDEEKQDHWPYLLVNQTDEDITVFQENPTAVAADGSEFTFYEAASQPKRYHLAAHSVLPYSWDIPAMKEKHLILGINGRERSVSLQEIGVQPPFRYKTTLGRPAIAAIDVKTQKSRQILLLSPFNQNSSLFRPLRTDLQPSASSSEMTSNASKDGFETVDMKAVISLKFEIKLAQIGLSFINKNLQELAYLSLKNVELRLTDSSMYQSVRCKIEWVQIDNQLYETAFPILLYPSNTTKHSTEELVPTFQLAFDRVKDNSHGVLYIKYFSLLLQELKIEMDEEFVHAMADFANLNGPGWKENVGCHIWEYDTDIADAKENEDNPLLYFELLTIQPIRIDLSFLRSPQAIANNASPHFFMFFANILTLAIGNVNSAPIRFNALVIENIMATQGDLSNRIYLHYSDQLIYQIHRMIGSADFLGNPVGLFNNLSSGVAELFYEPWQGLIMSDRPQDLGLGLARGFSGFIRKSVFGVTDSFTKFTGSIGKGLSAATMDRQYQERRRMTMARNRPQHALGGVTRGANYFANSLASGVSGLVTQPIEGASKEGVGGFFTGVGKGLIGAVTKPVVGVFDLASNVTEGIRNTTTPLDTNVIMKVRYPRFIGQSGVLKPFSAKEAQGQLWLKTTQGGKYFDDVYIAHCRVQTDSDRIAMLTSNRLMMMRTNHTTVEWQEPFTDIQTIKCEPTGIAVYLRSMTWEPFLMIPDKNTRDWIFKKIEEAVLAFNAHQKSASK